MEARISSKGQITLPSKVRRQLKIHTGDTLLMRAVGKNSLILEVRRKSLVEKREASDDVITSTAGIWKDREDIDGDYIRRLRQSDNNRIEGLLTLQPYGCL
ncbi:MAG: AbrB/MazE/SpoVT family DNA-binding domain-containing protein [Firmicutes bacterium]|nr:AbrB/MazE/SpoVT family DNA-binding domain-containing protein [Bacillota bacterium]